MLAAHTPAGATLPYAYLFAPRHAALPPGFEPMPEPVVLDAIARIGGTEPHAYTATCAFEAFLAELAARCWQPRHAARLSVQFLVAFGNELTPRLDATQRIRSTALEPNELAALSSPPLAAYIDQQQLSTFQLPMAHPAPHPTPHASSSPFATTGGVAPRPMMQRPPLPPMMQGPPLPPSPPGAA